MLAGRLYLGGVFHTSEKEACEINQYAYLGTTFLVGVLPLIAAALVEQSIAPQLDLTPTVIGSVLYIGVGASLVSYILWTKAVTTVGPVTSSLIYYSLPAFCGIEAYLFLGEPVTGSMEPLSCSSSVVSYWRPILDSTGHNKNGPEIPTRY